MNSRRRSALGEQICVNKFAAQVIEQSVFINLQGRITVPRFSRLNLAWCPRWLQVSPVKLNKPLAESPCRRDCIASVGYNALQLLRYFPLGTSVQSPMRSATRPGEFAFFCMRKITVALWIFLRMPARVPAGLIAVSDFHEFNVCNNRDRCKHVGRSNSSRRWQKTERCPACELIDGAY